MSGATVVALLAALLAAAVATGAVRALALRLGTLDAVDPSRRLHTTPTPRLGGIGIAIGLAVGLLVARATGAAGVGVGVTGGRGFAGAVLVLALAGGLGFVDDLRPRGAGLPAWLKLALQVSVAGIAVLLGFELDGTAFGPWGAMDLGGAAPLATAAWIVAVLNVVNFMDGSDALLGTTAIVILAAAAGLAPGAAAATLAPLATATLGFLLWNAPPAKIFMGDGGSHLLGAALALAPCSFLDASGDAHGSGAPWPIVGAALLPSILDVAEALVHKARHRIPMARAHHDHLYQRLVKATGSHGAVALRYGALALVAVVVVGPLAQTAGAAVAAGVGALVLAAHWVQGVRRTRGVPRLTRA